MHVKKKSNWLTCYTQEPKSLFDEGCTWLFIAIIMVVADESLYNTAIVFAVFGVGDILLHAWRMHRRNYYVRFENEKRVDAG